MASSITSSSSSPYNITLTSDSPTINYLPYRDGPATGGWNMSCSGSDPTTYIPQTFCLGVASRQSSFVGASLYVDFLGTAAYFFGAGDALSFTFDLDDQVRDDLIVSNPSSRLLAKAEGLSYGQHRIYLNVTQAVMLTLDEVVLTIAIGQSYGTVRNQTVVPFTQTSSDGSPTLNKNFIYTGDWMTDVPGTIGVTGDVIYPRQHTSETGAYVTFQVSQTSAFFIYGLVNVDLGPFSVTLTPPTDLGQPITNFYNSNAHYIGLDRVMYWTSGLDRDRVYSVKIANLGQGATPWWDFNRVELLDGGFNTTDKAIIRKHHKVVPVGPIAGAAAAGLLLLALLILGWIWYGRRTRAKAAIATKPKLDMLHESQESKPFIAHSPPFPGYSGFEYTSFPPPHAQGAGLPFTYIPPPQVMMHVTPSRTNLNVASSSARTSLPLQQQQQPQPQPQDSGSADLSYTKSGLMMSWNSSGSGDTSGLSGQGMGPAVPVVREHDAGSLSSPGEAVFRLPPNYNDSWSRDRVQ